MEVPYKTENRLTIRFSSSTPGHISRKDDNSNLKRYMHPSVHNRTVYNSQDEEVTCVHAAAAAKSLQSCPTLATPWTAAYQAPPSMGFSKQKYWSGVPLPSPKCP